MFIKKEKIIEQQAPEFTHNMFILAEMEKYQLAIALRRNLIKKSENFSSFPLSFQNYFLLA